MSFVSDNAPPSKKSRPASKFAVVRMQDSDNVTELLSYLVKGGYPDVEFLDDLKEHQDVSCYVNLRVKVAKEASRNIHTRELSLAYEKGKSYMESVRKETVLNACSITSVNSTTVSYPLSVTPTRFQLSSPVVKCASPVPQPGSSSEANGPDLECLLLDSGTNEENTKGNTAPEPGKSDTSAIVPPMSLAGSISSQKTGSNCKVIVLDMRKNGQTEQNSALTRLLPSRGSVSNSIDNPNINHIEPRKARQDFPDVEKTDRPSRSSLSHVIGNPNIKPIVPRKTRQDFSEADVEKMDNFSDNKSETGRITCKLCGNVLHASRMTNLVNHVRRHSMTKQFKCNFCSYQHNEASKVRNHQASAHKNISVDPIDQVTMDLQKQWGHLMGVCFPLENSTFKHRWLYGAGEADMNMSMQTCIECNETVHLILRKSPGYHRQQLVRHLLSHHREDCVATTCTKCSFTCAEEWKVRWHISIRHAAEADTITVAKDRSIYGAMRFIPKFFPHFKTTKTEDELDVQEETDILHAISNKKSLDVPVNARPSSESVEIVKTPEKVTSEFSVQVKEEVPDSVEKDKVEEPNDETPETSCPMIDVADLPSKQPEKKVDEFSVSCKLCGKVLEFQQRGSLCTLITHAKRHYHIKQYECPNCPYASSEAAHVRNHINRIHKETDKPVDVNCSALQLAWMHVAKICFADVADRIEHFRFKGLGDDDDGNKSQNNENLNDDNTPHENGNEYIMQEATVPVKAMTAEDIPDGIEGIEEGRLSPEWRAPRYAKKRPPSLAGLRVSPRPKRKRVPRNLEINMVDPHPSCEMLEPRKRKEVKRLEYDP